jgi:hypothetical protein
VIQNQTSGLTPWWAPLRFRVDHAVLFPSLWSVLLSSSGLPTGICPKSTSKAHLRCNWVENYCASYFGDTKSKKYQKNKSKICKIWISTSALTLWWAPLSFRADRAVLFLSLWSTVPSQSDFPTGRAPNSNSQAPNSESGWCFKFRAKTCGISIGHTFYPIELKIGVLPLVIQNHKKLSKK